MGRIVNQDSLTKAKRKEAYIRNKNMLIGYALKQKLAEDKIKRSLHQRADIINVKKGDE